MDDKDWGIYGKGFDGYAHYYAAYKSTQHIAGQEKSSIPPSQRPWTEEEFAKKKKECIKIWSCVALEVLALITMDDWLTPILDFIVGLFI